MSQFKPYSIQHVQITSLRDISLPEENTLFYYWWRTIPLGHVWFEAKRKHSIVSFKKMIADSIYDAMHGYVGGDADDVHKLMCAYINRENIGGIEAYCNFNLSKFLFENNEKHSETISVVICTRNRPQAIESCIQSLLHSTDADFELIVVDNNPDNDLTKQIVSKYPSVKYILEPRKGLDIARNTGAKNASHSIIAYTDDDVVIDKNWIKNMKLCFNDPKTMAVTGMVMPVALNEWSQYVFERYWGFNKGYRPATFDTKFFNEHVHVGVPAWEIGAGANMAFRKVVFDMVGYFDERLDVGAAGCSGDSEMWYRILAEGFNCYYNPQLVAYHQHRESREALYHQIYHYMRGQVASVMVQYENYGFKGDKRRVMWLLPKYYCKRIYSLFRGLHRGVNDYNKTLFTEIRGCISGYKFYKTVQQNKYQIETANQLVIK